MGFDLNKFGQADLMMRTSVLDVPTLAVFFGSDESPKWQVTGLSGEQVALVNEAADRNKNMSALMTALIGGAAQEKAESIKSLMGVNAKDVPEDTAKRIEVLMLGSLDPVCDRETAIKLNEFFPMEFTRITNEIYRLTGEGGEVVGKPEASTETLR